MATAAVIGVLLSGGPAAAHADLESTSPTQGAQLTSQPGAVVLTFSEAVSLPARAIIVLDSQSNRVDTGAATHPDGNGAAAAVALRPLLPAGSYLVVWHVTSDDGHPVSGNFAFGIDVPAAPSPAAVTSTPDTTLGAVRWLAQFIAFAGTLVLIGAVVVLLRVWPTGATSRAARHTVTWAWCAALAGTVLLLAVGVAYGAGGRLADVFSTATLSSMLATTAGRLGALRVVVLMVGALIWWRARRAGRLPRLLEMVGLALLTVETLGGLVVVATGVLRRPVRVPEPVLVTGGVPAGAFESPVPDETGPVLTRWSRLATASVALVAATGAVSAVRDVGAWGALASTTYGRLVLGKVTLFAAIVLVASVSHRLVRRWADAPPGSAQSARLRRLVLVETAIALTIHGLTATLVATPPGAETYLPSFTTTLIGQAPTGERVTLDVLVRPTRPGFEGLTIHASSQPGAAVPITVANMTFTNRGTGIGPMDFPATTTTGQGVEDTIISVPGPGRWDVSMRILVDGRWYSASTSYEVG
ncbi:MAG: copper resistance protein CopC [Cellulomonas sp.]